MRVSKRDVNTTVMLEMSVHPSVWAHGTAPFAPDGFSRNYKLETFINFRRHMPVVIKIEPKADDSHGDQSTPSIISRRALSF
jgi:hypothetical protein